MMKKSLKRSAAFLAICSMVYLSFIGIGKHTLPQDYTAIHAQVATANAPFTAQISADPAQQVDFSLLGVFPVRSSNFSVVTRNYVIVGGDVFGIKLYTRGVLVARTDDVNTANGTVQPAHAAGLRSGDIITHIDGQEVARRGEVAHAVEQSGGIPLAFTVERGGNVQQVEVTPQRCADSERYTAGLWVRDSSAGIGTVTFFDKASGMMAGLGHAITDVDTGDIIPISGGELVGAKVMGIHRGADGAPGELCGMFEPQSLATLDINDETGVFGRLHETPQGDLVPVALRSEVRAGPAQIMMTAAGNERRTFDIEITRVALHSQSNQRNMTLRITDPELIEITGGIVQGMSGSPIMQNGMLVGAVTHVFVNSSLEGYGIFAETMLGTARGE
ncbi:MAG: SpoIVB peptidase [Oscillospiraceae bacterium]|nr:SpoIVB peptidase [Oscillospiraceae bacterium]